MKIADEFVRVRRGRMVLYLRPSHSEALLGIQVQRIGEWLETHYWAREVAFGRSTLALKRPALPDGSGLVIKGYHHGGILGSLLGKRYFSKRRVLEAVAAGDAARRAGVPVPLVVVAAAERAFPFGYRLYEGSLEVSDAEPLSLSLSSSTVAAVRVPRGARSRRRQVIEASARTVRTLHDAGIDHRDLNLANLVVTHSGGHVTVYVLDFDSARIGAPL
jgi:tRNA A-37 threonylcarbamoyl transferase component Bud32